LNLSSVYKGKKKKLIKKNATKLKSEYKCGGIFFKQNFIFQNLAIYFIFSQFGKILRGVFQKSFDGVGIQQNVQTFSFNPQHPINLVLYNRFNKLGFFSLCMFWHMV
jgi:hypothetical protein